MSAQRTPPYWTITAYGVLATGGVFAMLYGRSENNEALMAAGAVGVFLALGLVPVALLIYRAGEPQRTDAVERKIEELTGTVRVLAEQQALSDDARRVLNRDRERELLCHAIEEDIQSGDYDASLVLARELADRFGYRAEAEEFRKRIDSARAEHVDRAVATAIAQLDGLIIQRRWDAARVEAARIERLYPDVPRAKGLDHRVDKARQVYRSELESRFLQAAQDEKKVEEAMSLLKELDSYLSPEEAEPYMEVARGVVGKARENLAAQFKMAVHDKRPRQAVEIGQRIIDEFPNSRMAHQVRAMIDDLRRAAAAMG